MLVEEGLGLAGVGSNGAQEGNITALTGEGRLPARGAYRRGVLTAEAPLPARGAYRRGALTDEGGC